MSATTPDAKTYVIPPPPQASIAVHGTDARFPVRRVYCIGRNYAAHVAEMGGDAERDPPIFFQKPADAVVDSGTTIPYPSQTNNLHHEVELVVAIGKGGSDIDEASALDHIWGYGVGLDLTRRDIQSRDGKPWEIAKAFDRSFPVGPLSPVSEAGHLDKGRIWLTVNDKVVQESDLDQLIWTIPEIIARLSAFFTLAPGDVILTGTPHGVGPLVPGDTLVAGVDGLEPLTLAIGERRD
ncbi:fumarylacetoacetate hydrolase family protein [Pseudochelatococcus contaminans]|uniref:Fumarylpyruvate hydrolase n=1 Tax=Pseudochelatococcus contaminans TaxID=1538103 RepID=A0A7W6EGE1_9HYPH|nr:fumarylacetoacetate hydrolase family protein [Pseudochelatococcus contaminans]MBB3809388.1 fumarylpyruvate hydrolase [Pseudochelatococcus contaminans]